MMEVRVHIKHCVDGIVRLGTLLRLDNDRVTLTGGDVNLVSLSSLGIHTVHLDDLEGVRIDEEDGAGKSRHVDDAELVLLAGDELVVCSLAVVDETGARQRRAGVDIGYIKELREEGRALVVIPVCCGHKLTFGLEELGRYLGLSLPERVTVCSSSYSPM